MALPNIVFRQFAVSGADPSGYRAQDTHASFTKIVNTTVGNELDFGQNDITLSGVNSATKVVCGHMDSSGDLTTQLFNLRFWLSSVNAFTNGTVRFNQQRSSGWLQDNTVINDSAEQTPTSLPSSGNILRQDGSGIITGSGDTEVTEWIYLSVYTGNDMGVGLKGGGGRNSFRYRLSADYY